MSEPSLSLGEPADESDWRALVEKGLKGAGWERLTAKTADGVPIAPLYREPDYRTSGDPVGLPGAAPFVRGPIRDAARPWTIRQIFDHPDPERVNRDILADLHGGVSSIELRTQHEPGGRGVRIENARDLDVVLADVILDAAPVSLDAGDRGLWAADLLAAKLKGASGEGVAFNIDPLGMHLRTGASTRADFLEAGKFAARLRSTMPLATALRVDARPVHEAGASEAQEVGAALSAGISYVRLLQEAGLSADQAGASLLFTIAIGPDVLLETAKLRALRLGWARVMETFGAAPEARAARIQAVSSQRMLTRYDAYSNILRITTSAFAAAIGGADVITTLPFTDALGLPTPFSRRVARNTQHVLLEEAHAGQVADPAGGAWFVEKLTHDLAEKAWAQMQMLEAGGGLLASLDALKRTIAEARDARFARIATRSETITGVTDYPLLTAPLPAFEAIAQTSRKATERGLTPVRWAEQFERLRDRMEAQTPRPAIFFANVGALAEFSPRALFAQNLIAAGGIGAIGPETLHETTETMAAAFAASGARVAMLTGTDAAYAARAGGWARALQRAGAVWVVLAGKPGENEQDWRAAGVDQFVFVGQNAVEELTSVQTALGVGA